MPMLNQRDKSVTKGRDRHVVGKHEGWRRDQAVQDKNLVYLEKQCSEDRLRAKAAFGIRDDIHMKVLERLHDWRDREKEPDKLYRVLVRGGLIALKEVQEKGEGKGRTSSTGLDAHPSHLEDEFIDHAFLGCGVSTVAKTRRMTAVSTCVTTLYMHELIAFTRCMSAIFPTDSLGARGAAWRRSIIQLAYGGWEWQVHGELFGVWEKVDERKACHRGGEEGREGAGVQNVRHVVRLTHSVEHWQRDGPRWVSWLGFESDDWAIGCG
ncbi:hypothetical protein EI94DRAFT_1705330 [Lactarius quietus]|nr:hypothetical protein EI94DRAFT_1705330 [Lactarius quietus]